MVEPEAETPLVASAHAGEGRHSIVIRPTRGWVHIGFRELVAYHELLFFLAWRDIKVRYKQTALGAAWAILQPLASMLIFLVVFRKLAKVPSDGYPYPIQLHRPPPVAALQLLAHPVERQRRREQGARLEGVLPRLVVPIASTLSGLVDFAVAFCMVLVMMPFFGVHLGWHVVAVPFVILFAILTALAVGLWLSALNVKYRDVQYTIPFLTQFWLYATPIAYPSSLVPEKYRALYGLNPMAGVVDAFRWALLGATPSSWGLMALSAVMVLLGLAGGMAYFRRVEKTFADLV